MRQFYLVFLLCTSFCFSQSYLQPNKKISFGKHLHTNRDISFFSKVDSFGNLIITGTTEKDSTYTDVITTKLNTNLNLVWQKTASSGNELSYDTPLACYIDPSNSIYQIAQSLDGLNGTNGTNLFIVKYSTDGNMLWTLEIEKGTYYTSTLDENGRLRMVYSIYNETTQIFYFVTYNSDGSIFESFSKNDITNNSDGIYSNYSGFCYANGNYYQAHQRLVSQTYEYQIRKISASETISYLLNPYLEPDPTYSTIQGFRSGKMNIGEEGSMHYSFSMAYSDQIRNIKLTSTGDFVYSTLTPDTYEKEYLESYLNTSGNLCIINNSKLTGDAVDKTLSIDEYGSTGTLINQYAIPFTVADAVKHYEDGKILAYCSGILKLTDENLNLITQLNGPLIKNGDFEKINNSSIAIANTSYAKMYPEADYYSQLNIVVTKIVNNSGQFSYTYNGEGTSKIFNEKLVMDKDNNYIVLAEEKMGEDYMLGGGGSEGHLKRTITKYNSDLDILWSVEINNELVYPNNVGENSAVVDSNNNLFLLTRVPEENGAFQLLKISPEGNIIYQTEAIASNDIFLDKDENICIVKSDMTVSWEQDYTSVITTFSNLQGTLLNTTTIPGVSYLDTYKSPEGDSYTYFYDSRLYSENLPHKIIIYKNNQPHTSTNLEISNQLEGITIPEISNTGEIYLGTNQDNGSKINKIDLLGNIVTVPTDVNLSKIKLFSDGKLLTVHTGTHINIYNTNLSLYSTANIEGFADDFIPSLIEVNQHMLFNSYYNNRVVSVNKEGNVTAEFKLQGLISDRYAATDDNGDLILTGDFGYELQLNQDYQWKRGFLHRYSIDDILGTKDFTDTEKSLIKVYPNPSNNSVFIASETGTVKYIEVFDLSGRFIEKTQSLVVDISKYPEGIYLLKIYTSLGITTKKIIKK